jgi:hypothetical protein
MAEDALKLLKALAPQFEARGDATLSVFVDLATSFVSPSVYGKDYPRALAYVAAAILTDTDNAADGVAGPLIGRRAGEVSENFAAPVLQGRSRWEQNAYGRLYLALRDTKAGTKPTSTGLGTGHRGRCC